MGLDMYLNGKRYLFNYGRSASEDATLAKEIAALVKCGADFEVKEIIVRAAYWRKANEIHAWFVQNVQAGKDECLPHSVSREQLKDLRDACSSVLENNDLKESVLPTQHDFFFGSTEYDDFYYDSLRNTIAQIDKVLSLPECWDFEYCSSW